MHVFCDSKRSFSVKKHVTSQFLTVNPINLSENTPLTVAIKKDSILDKTIVKC